MSFGDIQVILQGLDMQFLLLTVAYAHRFFLFLKYNYLGGYGNKRVDKLLLLLDGDIAEYHRYATTWYIVDQCFKLK